MESMRSLFATWPKVVSFVANNLTRASPQFAAAEARRPWQSKTNALPLPLSSTHSPSTIRHTTSPTLPPTIKVTARTNNGITHTTPPRSKRPPAPLQQTNPPHLHHNPQNPLVMVPGPRTPPPPKRRARNVRATAKAIRNQRRLLHPTPFQHQPRPTRSPSLTPTNQPVAALAAHPRGPRVGP